MVDNQHCHLVYRESFSTKQQLTVSKQSSAQTAIHYINLSLIWVELEAFKKKNRMDLKLDLKDSHGFGRREKHFVHRAETAQLIIPVL